MANPRTAVTVFTGYLGAGKTSVILNLISQLPNTPGRQTVWLKNEFGEARVDSLLSQSAGIKSREVVNGCLCCVAVGHLGEALNDILRESSIPIDRILVETSGSAYPAPLAWEVRKAEASLPVVLDGVVTVVDCLNFQGYPDKSRAAKLQAQYTDLILLNKIDLLDTATAERRVDEVLDDLYEVNPDTPKVRISPGPLVHVDLVFGLDIGATRWSRGEHLHQVDREHMKTEVELLEFGPNSELALTRLQLEEFAKRLSADRVFRAKGCFARTDSADTVLVLNYVAGRHRIDEIELASIAPSDDGDSRRQTRVVLMGEGLRSAAKLFETFMGVSADGWRHTPRGTRVSM